MNYDRAYTFRQCQSTKRRTDIYNNIKSSSNKCVRAKKRPCVILNTIPNIEVLITSKVDGRDVTDPHLTSIDEVPYEYIMKRMVPIYPKPALEQRRSIQPMTAFDQQVNVGGTYVILIPITIQKKG